MSNTRHAKPGTPPRQWSYASSEVFERGLLANLVARRCELVESPSDRELIWFLQYLSWQEGGLAKVAADLIAQNTLGTESMQRFGMKPGQIYSEDEARKVGREIELDAYRSERRFAQLAKQAGFARSLLAATEQQHECGFNAAASATPVGRPAESFLKYCTDAAAALPDLLESLCLNPVIEVANWKPWFFPQALTALREYQAKWISARRASVVATTLGQTVYDVLDYTRKTSRLTMIDGLARTGKTFSARAWCEQHPGQARYVQVPSSNDDIGFFRAIAKGLGVSVGLKSKAQELRQRIEETLQRRDLVIVFDEAHYLWPNTSYRDALPARINWLMTALVNHRVGVCLVTTPQFMRSQKAVERKSSWTSEQFTGRIGHYEKLPGSLTEADLARVAQFLLPEGNPKAVEILVRYAQGSAKYLAGIEATVDRARYLASKDGRDKVCSADIKRAISESVIPSDSALTAALSEPEKPSRKRVLKPVETPFDAEQNSPAEDNFGDGRNTPGRCEVPPNPVAHRLPSLVNAE